MVRDVITHLLFAEDVAHDATGLANLDAGEILFIDAKGNALDSGELGALDSDDIFYIAEGKKGANQSHIISPRLTRASITGVRQKEYVVAKQQVSIISTINAVNNTEYSLSVSFTYDKDIYSKRHDVKRYSFVTDASSTAAEIIAGFVALMNADKDFARQAVASVDGSTLKITGKVLPESNVDNLRQVSFIVTLDKGFDSTTTLDEFGAGSSVAPTPGIGTSAALRALERNGLGYTAGQTNLTKFPVVGPEARVSASGTYNMFIIDYYNEHENGEIGLGATRKAKAQIIIAVNVATDTNSVNEGIEEFIEELD